MASNIGIRGTDSATRDAEAAAVAANGTEADDEAVAEGGATTGTDGDTTTGTVA